MKKILHNAKKIAKHASPAGTLKRHATKRTIDAFGSKLGWVYFGSVSQRDDEHRLLRGITATATHHDQHYTVGSYQGYDVALTVRRDTLHYPDNRLRDHFWTIMTFDLHTDRELPPLYIGHHKVRDELLARYLNLTPLVTERPGSSSEFEKQYTIYGSVAHAHKLDTLLPQEVRTTLARQFNSISIELSDNTLYLYVPTDHPSSSTLSQLLRGGTWLAQAFDVSARQLR